MRKPPPQKKGYSALPPYRREETTSESGMGLSVRANVIAVLFGTFLTAIPIVLATFSLPGTMVMAASNSAVISAACHAVNPAPPPPPRGTVSPAHTADQESTEEEEEETATATAEAEQSDTPSGNCSDVPGGNCTDSGEEDSKEAQEEGILELKDISTQKLRWGVVSGVGHNSPEDPGRLAFGVESQRVATLVDGGWYA